MGGELGVFCCSTIDAFIATSIETASIIDASNWPSIETTTFIRFANH
jgi:hypothetical protein